MTSSDLRLQLKAILQHLIGSPINGLEIKPIFGGDINQAYRVTSGNLVFFIKVNTNHYSQLFQKEAQGLTRLREVFDLRVPKVIGTHEGPSHQFLVLEYIEPGKKEKDFDFNFGRHLALGHKKQQDEPYGFSHSNFIGSTKQINDPNKSWVAFYKECRLGYQKDLAEKKGLLPPAISQRLSKLMEKLPQILPEAPNRSLLHGDLWGGNYLVDSHGHATLIDPAVYVGHYEADIAMTELFGGFSSAFYKAYEEVLPLDLDYRRYRTRIYNLYHMLNHLNLFGGSYLSSVEQLIRPFL